MNLGRVRTKYVPGTNNNEVARYDAGIFESFSSQYRRVLPIQRLVQSYIRSDRVVPFRYRGLCFRFRPLSYDPIVLYSILARRIYGGIPSGWSVVDIGAHIGIFSMYSLLSGAAKVLAFEPEEHNFELLRDNLTANGLRGRIQAFKLAVWSSSEERTLFTSKGSAFHGFFPDRHHVGKSERVSCIGINTLLDRVEHPVLLKIDAEGSEYEIINAITKENMRKVGRICAECHTGNPRLRPLLPVLLQEIRSRGFSVSYNSDKRIMIASRIENHANLPSTASWKRQG